jgi:hypothetical protein
MYFLDEAVWQEAGKEGERLCIMMPDDHPGEEEVNRNL